MVLKIGDRNFLLTDMWGLGNQLESVYKPTMVFSWWLFRIVSCSKTFYQKNSFKKKPNETLRYWYKKIQDLSFRKIAFPRSEKYRNKLADHYYERIDDEKKVHLYYNYAENKVEGVEALETPVAVKEEKKLETLEDGRWSSY